MDKLKYFLGFLFLSAFNLNAQTQSDTVDIYHTSIFIDIADVNTNDVNASTFLGVVAKMNNVPTITFDLTDDLIVDSVQADNQNLIFTHQNNALKVNFTTPLNNSDSLWVKIYYHGMFEQDPNGFGGNYFNLGYAYNVGVSLSISPHSYGRAWHPCFDNFVEKSTYDITLMVPDSLTAFCSGIKTLDSVSFNNRFTKWELYQPVSSYLTGFAVSDYEALSWDYISPYFLDTTEVLIAAQAADTQSVKISFQHLNNAIEIFEAKYGEYNWDRVGYVMTPFPYGAMEHATNIVYPLSVTSGGNLDYEDLMAHELSHHWWGDYITTENSKEMWINEGSARFSEFVFLEGLYGQSAYKKDVYDNHYDVLLQHYIVDSGYYAIANVPESFTYGETTYNKGADVLYNLRGYLGDSLFFMGLRGVLDSAKWSTLNSTDFMNYMGHTINQDLTDFFEGWVFQPGFPDFDIDGYSVTGDNGNFEVALNIGQGLRGLSVYHNNVPLILTLVDQNMNDFDYQIMVSGPSTDITLNTTFEPVAFYLNKDRIINYATTVTDTNFLSNPLTYVQSSLYNTQSLSGNPIRVRSEMHWVAPRGEAPNHVVLSKDRYWHIDGPIDGNNLVAFNLFFAATGSGSYYMDNGLKDFVGTSFTEDSLVLMYRENPNESWEIYTENVVFSTLGDPLNGHARFQITSLNKSGQFTFGYKLYNAGLDDSGSQENWLLFPNPVLDVLNLKNISWKTIGQHYQIVDDQGKQVQSGILDSNQIEVQQLTKGVYFLIVNETKAKFVKQ